MSDTQRCSVCHNEDVSMVCARCVSATFDTTRTDAFADHAEIARLREEIARLREQERLAKERAEAVEASYRRMLPVYEAAVAWFRDGATDDTDLYGVCDDAFAADRDREGES